jgi:hypothetical protein
MLRVMQPDGDTKKKKKVATPLCTLSPCPLCVRACVRVCARVHISCTHTRAEPFAQRARVQCLPRPTARSADTHPRVAQTHSCTACRRTKTRTNGRKWRRRRTCTSRACRSMSVQTRRAAASRTARLCVLLVVGPARVCAFAFAIWYGACTRSCGRGGRAYAPVY